MRGYEVRVAVDLDRVEEAARRSGREIDEFLNEFVQRLHETGESLVAGWCPERPRSSRLVLPSGHEIVELPDSALLN